MTTKISKIRVSELAKELGVPFKEIQARCDTEGVDTPKTASSTISRGLAETIRQWFQDAAVERAVTGGAEAAEASAATATEDAPAKKPVRRSTKGKAAAEPAAPADAAAPPAPAAPAAEVVAAPAVPEPTAPVAAPVAAAPVAPAPVVAAPATPVAPAPAAPVAPAPAPVAAAPAAPVRDDVAPRLPGEGIEVVTSPDSAVMHPAVDAPVTPAIIGKAHRAPARPAEAAPPRQTITRPPAGHTIAPASKPPVMNVPRRPDVVKPVGTMLDQPVKTALSGPKVIRVEQPDNLPAPRRMPPGGTGLRGPNNRVGTGGPSGPGGRTDRPGRSNSSPNRSGRAGEGRGRDTSGGFTRQDLSERDERLQHAGGFFKQRRRQQAQRDGHAAARAQTSGPQDLAVRVTEPISIKELSEASGVKAADILKKLMLAGQITTINGTIETERAIEIMMEYGIDLQVTQAQSAAEIIESQFEKRERQDERSRPPVVTILGHVDHGKTSLLDRIRNTNVASGEAGGITQATSAFQVPVKAGEKERVVTFIDTPGHEAFTQMRARGARVTDIAVLVVAADDGVMPQTVESIAHAKAAGVPIVVALNKIDKPEATQSNIQRILGQLAEQGLNPVEWGGDTEVIRVSATKGTGIQELLDMLDYQADLRDLKADAKGLAQGSCLEAQMEEGRGTVARILVQEGQLKKGDFIVCGRAFGRVRDIVGDRGGRVETAGPSTPVAISGLDELPDAGDKFYCVKSLKEAENAAVERRRIERERELAAPKITLDNIFEHMGKAGVKELPLVVKADVQGSVETLRSVLSKIKSDEVAVSVKHAAVGGINESDVALAEATKAIVVGFNVTSNAKARALAEAKGIEMRLYDVIYDLTDDVAKAASGLLEPELKLEVLGHAEVREVYKISKVGAVAGCYVTDGTVERNAQIRVTRGGIVVEKDRRLEQLKRFKDDAKEVRAGNECGMKIDGYDDIKVGDVLECYKTIKVARGLAAAARKE